MDTDETAQFVRQGEELEDVVLRPGGEDYQRGHEGIEGAEDVWLVLAGWDGGDVACSFAGEVVEGDSGFGGEEGVADVDDGGWESEG